jgi:hypothetical protein
LLDRFRVQGPIVRLQPFLDVEHALVTAKGVPLANESDHLPPQIHQPERGFGTVFVPGDLEPNGRLPDRIAGPMTTSQANTLRSLAVEAYQEKLFQPDLSRAEAAKRIDLLKREIELANSF